MKLIRIVYSIVLINYIVLLVGAIAENQWNLVFADIGLIIWCSVAWVYFEKGNEQRIQLKIQNEMIIAQQNLISKLKQNNSLMKETAELREKIIVKQQWIINQTKQQPENENTDKNN